jgi:hypothetical protein
MKTDGLPRTPFFPIQPQKGLDSHQPGNYVGQKKREKGVMEMAFFRHTLLPQISTRFPNATADITEQHYHFSIYPLEFVDGKTKLH